MKPDLKKLFEATHVNATYGSDNDSVQIKVGQRLVLRLQQQGKNIIEMPEDYEGNIRRSTYYGAELNEDFIEMVMFRIAMSALEEYRYSRMEGV